MSKDLQAAYDKALAKRTELQTEKDEALAKVKETYGKRLAQAHVEAAHAQKALLDHQAAAALVDREDGEAVAQALGLTLPD